MTLRRSIWVTMLVLLIALVAASAIQAENVPGRPQIRPGFKVAGPRIGIASPTDANADNFMIANGATAEDPLATVQSTQWFRLRSSYEVTFFPTGIGSAQFELEVYLLNENDGRRLLGSDQVMIAGVGPKRSAGCLHVDVTLSEPGVYRLAIVSRSTAQAVSAPEPVVDEDEIIVYVIVTEHTVTPPPPEESVTATPTLNAHRVAVQPKGDSSQRNQARGLALLPHPTPRPTVTAVPLPTDEKLRVASPRGHFISPSVAAAENFDQNHGRVLVVREGDTITFKSAYEFVWFHGAAGTAQTELSVRLASAREDDPPLAEDRVVEDRPSEIGEPRSWKLAGTLEAEVLFDEAGHYDVIATIRTQVEPAGRTLDVVTEDEDRVRVHVLVLGQPEVGAISGTVTEADNDVPLEGIMIRVVDAHAGRTHKIVYTNEEGDYTATGLEPGTYLVYADPLAQNYLAEWYDDSPTREDADPVTVVAHETTEGIDFGLTPGAVISGLVIEDNLDLTSPSPSSTPIGNVLVIAGNYDDNTVVAKTHTLRDGSYRLEKLPEGTYWVHAGGVAWASDVSNPMWLIGEYWDDHLLREDADPVPVSEGGEVTGIDFALRYGGSISGRVVGDGVTAVLTPFKVTAYDWESNEVVLTVSVDPRGYYNLWGLPEGQYRVYAFDEDGRYIPEYYDDVTNPDDATAVEVRRGKVTGDIDFKLTLAGVATLEIQPLASQVQPGDTFTVTVEIKDVMDLGAYSFELTFNPAVLEALDVTLGDFLGSTGRSVVELGPTISNTVGTLAYGAASFGEQEGPNGSGVLATITFLAVEPGDSPLKLENTQVTDTQAKPIEHCTKEARVRVGECIFGDFDCDCDVDIADIMQVALRWGTVEGDPEYDPTYDLDNDGDIDIVDVALVAAAWGNTCDEETAQLQRSSVQAEKLAAPMRSTATTLTTGLRLEPEAAEATVGEPVTLAVWIDEAFGLGGFEFTLNYDATRLEVSAKDVVLGDFLGSTGRSPALIGPRIDVEDGLGTLSVGAMTLGSTPPGPDGSGVLVEIIFRPLAGGQAKVTFVAAQVTDTTGGSQEQLAMQDATVNIESPASSFIPIVKR